MRLAQYKGITALNSVVVVLLPLALQIGGCKPFEEDEHADRPEAKATQPYQPMTQQPYSGNTQNPAGNQVTPPCDPDVYICQPDPKIVTLCKTKETDVTRCEPKIEKSFYQELQQLQASSAAGLKCTEGYYIKTVTRGDIVRVRSSAEIKDENIIGSVTDGDPKGVCVVSNEGGWTKILYNTTTAAFVSSQFVTTSKPSANAGGSEPKVDTGSQKKELANGGLVCPSGYFAAKGRSQLFKQPDYYTRPQSGLTSSGDMHAGLFFCSSNITQTVSGLLPYVMVKVLIPPLKTKNTDYWMECKYLADGYRQKAGCP